MLMAAPFIVDTNLGKWMLISALGIVAVQSYHLKAYNIVFANLTGIIGYLYVLYL